MSGELAKANGEATTTGRQDDRPQSFGEVLSIAKVFVESQLFKDVPSVAKAAVKIMAGRELGFGPFASMSGVHIIAGKAEPGANLLAALVKRSGRYDYRVKRIDNEACEIEFFEGEDLIGVSQFTLEDAKKAGTQNIHKYPRNMLFARALSNGVKWFCPDVENGVTVYAPGEIEDVAPACGPALELPPPGPEPDIEPRPRVTAEQLIRMELLVGQLGWSDGALGDRLRAAYGVGSMSELSPEQAVEVEEKMESVFRRLHAGAGA